VAALDITPKPAQVPAMDRGNEATAEKGYAEGFAHRLLLSLASAHSPTDGGSRVGGEVRASRARPGRTSGRWSRQRPAAEPFDRLADPQGRIEDLPDRHEALQPVPSDGLESRGGDAAAVLAIGLAPELARHDPTLEIRRVALGGLGEDAIVRRLR